MSDNIQPGILKTYTQEIKIYNGVCYENNSKYIVNLSETTILTDSYRFHIIRPTGIHTDHHHHVPYHIV